MRRLGDDLEKKHCELRRDFWKIKDTILLNFGNVMSRIPFNRRKEEDDLSKQPRAKRFTSHLLLNQRLLKAKVRDGTYLALSDAI